MQILFILLTLSLIGCSTNPSKVTDRETCFLLFNLHTQQFDKIINESFCKERQPAASTFKVPLAVMAFHTKILRNEHSKLRWNSYRHTIEIWNRDHTAETWMRDSVIWFSQELTKQIGQSKLQLYSKLFGFGNADFSGGLKYAWLTPAPFIHEPMENSLKISPFEQVKLLSRLWRNELGASQQSQEKTRNILVSENSPKNFILSGKTGSGFVGSAHDLHLGWFVAHLQGQGKEYIVVTNFVENHSRAIKGFAGSEAKTLTKNFLVQEGLW